MVEIKSAQMDSDLAELHKALSDELSAIGWHWSQYRILFGDKPERIDLLNQTAGSFFRVVQDVLFEDTVLAIARLLSPPKSVGNDNLSVERLRLSVSTELEPRVSELIVAAKTAASFTKDWRHRRLAHRALGLALQKPEVVPLAAISRANIEKALSALGELLNFIELAHCGSTTLYSQFIALGDAEDLLYVIRDGLRRARDRHECWDREERHVDDVNPPEAV